MTQDRVRVAKVGLGNFDVYIGRGSLWGNQFRIGVDGDRQQVIEKYREWIKEQPYLLGKLWELKGKVLGCHCAPLPCHGDILIEMLEEL
ncbi:hypothetical protein LCGC14_1321150 [marine sediment metagenome]|uniref:DUF4326 domain-containing protein n=1 Tax=marine sediment metagenome TaxID=412755 RepID=A0A0F9KJK3_9ZZZZ